MATRVPFESEIKFLFQERQHALRPSTEMHTSK